MSEDKEIFNKAYAELKRMGFIKVKSGKEGELYALTEKGMEEILKFQNNNAEMFLLISMAMTTDKEIDDE